MVKGDVVEQNKSYCHPYHAECSAQAPLQHCHNNREVSIGMQSQQGIESNNKDWPEKSDSEAETLKNWLDKQRIGR